MANAIRVRTAAGWQDIAVQGAQGVQGPTGPTGPTGSQGAAGAPGEKWFSQAGAPAGATGIVGDWALDTTTGDAYEKTGASTWTLRANLKGPAGSLTGAAGGVLSGTYPNPGFAALQARQAFVFSNGYRAYNNGGTALANYYRDPFGIVHFEGLLDKSGGNYVGGGETVLTMPAGYRPITQGMHFFLPMSGGGGNVAQGRVEMLPDGRLVMYSGGPANPVDWISIPTITYRAT